MARKRCPQCAEKVQAEARLCRYCGFQFAEGDAAPAVAAGAPAADIDTARAGAVPWWRSPWARGAALVVYVLATGPLLVSESTREDGAAATVAAIVFEPLLVLALAGAVIYVVRRFAVRRPVPFWQCVFSVPVMLTCFVLAAVSAAGREADAQVALTPAGTGGEAAVVSAAAGTARRAGGPQRR